MRQKLLWVAGAILIALCFQNCSKTSNNQSDNSNNNGNPSRTIASTSAYIRYNGSKFAYVLSISADRASLYLPSYDRYVDISIRTGKYQPGILYYTEAGCQGSAIATYFPGVMEKGIIFSNGKYYVARSALTNYFSYKSSFIQYDYTTSLYGGGCSSISNPQPMPSQGYLVEEVERPFNFENIAPLDIHFE